MPITGVGGMLRPSVSLEAPLPLITGVPNARQASRRPAIACWNCHITSGFGTAEVEAVGDPTGSAPLAARFRAASATALTVPT
jgi:hypothetical protein